MAGLINVNSWHAYISAVAAAAVTNPATLPSMLGNLHPALWRQPVTATAHPVLPVPHALTVPIALGKHEALKFSPCINPKCIQLGDSQ